MSSYRPPVCVRRSRLPVNNVMFYDICCSRETSWRSGTRNRDIGGHCTTAVQPFEICWIFAVAATCSSFIKLSVAFYGTLPFRKISNNITKTNNYMIMMMKTIIMIVIMTIIIVSLIVMSYFIGV